MDKQDIVIINGAQYDAATGLRLQNQEVSEATNVAVSAKKVAHAAALHKKQTRATTLSRSHVKNPTRITVSVSGIKPTIKKSPHIHKFAPNVPVAAPKAQPTMSDIAPTQHPLQKKVAARTASASLSKQASIPASSELKARALENALANSGTKKGKQKSGSFIKRHPRLLNAGAASFAIILLAGYLTYLNLPNLSVKVAAVQAGIAASYPSYQPSGYSLNGPVAYSNGQVNMKFAANVGPQNFEVSQSKTTWDSSALLENYVAPSSKGQYETFTDGGLTVYVYGSNAAWVNGGILYSIEGNAPLSSDQIRKIATSM